MRIRIIWGGALVFGAAIACTTKNATDATRSPTVESEASVADGSAGQCTQVAGGRFCLQGTLVPSTGAPGDDAEDFSFQVGDPVVVDVVPAGCHDGACTETPRKSCSVSGSAGSYVVTPDFCLRDITAERQATLGCDETCDGITAECRADATLVAGQNTVTMGGATFTFTVPGTMPQDSACAGAGDAY